MTFACTCKTCDKRFQSQRKDSTICYGCTFAELIGKGGPEESDINTALIRSGEMSDADALSFQEDLQSIEEGRSIREPYRDEAKEEYVDPAWCYACNRDTAFCKCICHECGEGIEDCQCSK